MPEQDQLAQLDKMRRVATGLLVAMAIVFVCARLFQPTYSFLSYVAAFSEAAMVGALADWFAVTALFRRPLGLPIPHTAIIPANKDRIGGSVAHFLEHNFMTHAVLSEELDQVDFAGGAADWLSQPENSRVVALQLVGIIPTMLRVVEDDDVKRFMHRAVAGAMRDTRFSPILANVLSVLVAGKHHQALFDEVIKIAVKALETNKPYIRQKVHEHSPAWMPKMLDEKFFERLIDGVESILDEMQCDGSEWRARFYIATEDFIEKLHTTTEYEEQIGKIVALGLGHPVLLDYIDGVWLDIKERLLADITSNDSQVLAKLDGAIRIFGSVLVEDSAVRNKLNRWIREFAVETITARREFIAGLVKRVIQKWDAETVSRKFELHVGKDLQYIRINGTLVGGLVGLILHMINLALF